MSWSSTGRSCLRIVMLAAVALPCFVPTARAADPPIQLSGSLVLYHVLGTPGEPNRCLTDAALQFPDSPGIASYSLTYDDSYYGPNRSKGGPPFSDDGPSGYTLQSSPAGQHRFVVSSSSTPDGCSQDSYYASRFTNIRVTGLRKPGTFELSGTVRSVDGKPIPGESVTAGGNSTATGPDGHYAFALPQGSYTVTPASRKGGPFVPRQRTVNLSGDTRSVDFQQGHDQVTLSADPSSVSANGIGVLTVTATDRDSAGNPVANQPLQIEPPATYDQPGIYCDASGRLVSPTVLSSGFVLPTHFNRLTDSNGQVKFTVFLGTIAGVLRIDAGEPDQPRSQWGNLPVLVGNSSGRGQLPPELPALLIGAGTNELFAGGRTTLLRWLGRIKQDGTLNGIGYMPIHATDAAGRPHDGVALFAEASRQQVSDYLDGKSSAEPAPETAQVIDVDNLKLWEFGQLVAGHLGHSVQNRLQTVLGWERGETIQFTGNRTIAVPGRGRALAGFAHPQGNDALLYGTGPYPPFGADAQTQSTFTSCVDRNFSPGTSITVHSPISVVLTDAHGARGGVPAKGKPIDKLAGSLVSYKGRHVRVIEAPAGSYRLNITGIGKGKATLVIRSGSTTEAFTFTVKRRQRGSLQISPGRVPAVLRFGGKKIHGIRGVPMFVTGLPKKLRRGRTTDLRLRVRDQFARPVPIVFLTLRQRNKVLGFAMSHRNGTISLSARPMNKGPVTATLVAPGFQTLTRTLRVGG